MRRLIPALALVAGVLALQQAGPVIVRALPTSWGYTLSPFCYWVARPWTRLLGADDTPRVDAVGEGQVYRCARGHGLKSRTPFLNTVLPRWPSKADFAAWEEIEDEDRGPLPAGR